MTGPSCVRSWGSTNQLALGCLYSNQYPRPAGTSKCLPTKGDTLASEALPQPWNPAAPVADRAQGPIQGWEMTPSTIRPFIQLSIIPSPVITGERGCCCRFSSGYPVSDSPAGSQAV